MKFGFATWVRALIVVGLLTMVGVLAWVLWSPVSEPKPVNVSTIQVGTTSTTIERSLGGCIRVSVDERQHVVQSVTVPCP
jgi:hypothetical protein